MAAGQSNISNRNITWQNEVESGMPLPTKLYTSPLCRAIESLELTFQNLIDLQQSKPTVLEELRASINWSAPCADSWLYPLNILSLGSTVNIIWTSKVV